MALILNIAYPALMNRIYRRQEKFDTAAELIEDIDPRGTHLHHLYTQGALKAYEGKRPKLNPAWTTEETRAYVIGLGHGYEISWEESKK